MMATTLTGLPDSAPFMVYTVCMYMYVHVLRYMYTCTVYVYMLRYIHVYMYSVYVHVKMCAHAVETRPFLLPSNGPGYEAIYGLASFFLPSFCISH